MSILGAVALGSSIASGIAGISRGRRQKRLAEERAREKRLQQQEIARRTESEIELIRSSADQQVGTGFTQYAGSGIDVSSASSAQAMMASYENMGRVIMNKQYESRFRIDQLKLEEKWELKQGEAMRDSSVISAFGSLLGTGVRMDRALGGGNTDGQD